LFYPLLYHQLLKTKTNKQWSDQPETIFPQEDIIDCISPSSGKLCVSNNRSMMFQAGGLNQWNFNYHWWSMSSCHTPRFCCWQHQSETQSFRFRFSQTPTTKAHILKHIFTFLLGTIYSIQSWLKHVKTW
jgi:hypothetical protein